MLLYIKVVKTEKKDIEDGDKSIENDYDEITSHGLTEVHRSEVRVTRSVFCNT